MTRSYRVRSMLLAVITVGMASVAITEAAFAQSRRAATRDAGGPVVRSHEDNPGTFREGGSLNSSDVGTGQASNTAAGPSGELAGSSTPPPGEIVGPIGPGDAARLIRASMPRLQPCYDRALATHPGLQGRLELRFTIERTGRVRQAVAAGMPEAPEVGTCLADVLRATTFPTPENGSLQLFYPVQFSPPAPVRPVRGGRSGARPAHGSAAAH